MYKDYEYWYKENKDLIDHLAHHQSLIYDRYQDIFNVLNYVKDLDPKKIDSDLEVIFDSGFAYIYDRINYIKTYLKDNFINDLHVFLKYEEIFNYYLYVEDLFEAFGREEMDIEPVRSTLEDVSKEALDIINSRKQYDKDTIEKFDLMVSSVVPSSKEVLTVPEIFNRVNEEIIIKKAQEGIE